MNRLALTYRHDPDPNDDFGWFGLAVETKKFHGEGGFWVQWQDVVEFGEALPQSPVRLTDPLIVQWGYDKQEGDDLIIRIEIAPYGSLGELVVSVELADSHEQTNRVKVSYKTTYAALDLFKRDIGQLMSNEVESAELLGRETT